FEELDFPSVNNQEDFRENYEIGIHEDFNLPILLFFEKESGDFSAFQLSEEGPEKIPREKYKFISLRFRSLEDADLQRFLVIFNNSGLPEEFDADDLPDWLKDVLNEEE